MTRRLAGALALGPAVGETGSMGVQLTKDSIDLGIVVRDIDKALGFYRDVLGFEHVGDGPMPGGMHMHRLLCGTSLIKLVTFTPPPEASNPPGGLNKATGYRYWTISVGNLDAITEACDAAGVKIRIPATEIRPGVRISMVEDPDGNWSSSSRTPDRRAAASRARQGGGNTNRACPANARTGS